MPFRMELDCLIKWMLHGRAKAVGLLRCLKPRSVMTSYDRFHVIAMANEAMDSVRRQEMRTEPEAVKEALGDNDRKLLKGLTWGMRRNPQDWTGNQFQAMHWLQHTRLQSARAWRLKMALREVYARAAQENNAEQAKRAARASRQQKTLLPLPICACPNSRTCHPTHCNPPCHFRVA